MGHKQKPGGLRHIGKRLVENPHRSDALVADEFRVLEAAGIEDRRKLPGFIEADVNLATMIGGLARVKDVSEAQKHAAARLRGLYERSLIGAARAIDYAAVRVDVSGVTRSDDVDRGLDARAEYETAVKRLGAIHASLVLPAVLEDQSLRALARRVGEGQGGAAIERVKVRLLEGVDVLVRHFGFGGAPAGRGKVRADGDVPLMFSPGERPTFIASRRVRDAA